VKKALKNKAILFFIFPDQFVEDAPLSVFRQKEPSYAASCSSPLHSHQEKHRCFQVLLSLPAYACANTIVGMKWLVILVDSAF
jgi:hypothetical protein